jgi:hypothetical protein
LEALKRNTSYQQQAMDPVVLRLPRLDHHPQDEPSFVLVHVTSAGAHPLDLDLIGTDNDAGFSVSCKVTDRPAGSTLGHQFHALIRQLIKFWVM